MHYYCTYFDQNYLTKGLALIESLEAQAPGAFRLYVVCLDQFTFDFLVASPLPGVVPVPLASVELGDRELAVARSNRNAVEYYWTLTPTIIRYLISTVSEIDVLTYLDSDMYFFGNPQAILEELGEKSVLIHPHRFPPRLMKYIQYGTYNVGALCFRNSPQGRTVLDWWRARCLEWCYQRLEGTKFGDQGYLNEWPEQFADVFVTQHPGIGLAPWNFEQHVLSKVHSQIFVDEQPLVLYHFHSVNYINPDVLVLMENTEYLFRKDVAAFVYGAYADSLDRQLSFVRESHPEFDKGLENPNKLNPQNALLIRSQANVQVNSTVPLVQLNETWRVYPGGQYEECELREENNTSPLKISLVLFVKDHGDTLERCIRDILAENYPNLELVVLDAGSTDGCLSVLEKYRRHFAFFESLPGKSQPELFQLGFSKCTGDIFGWLTADTRVSGRFLSILNEVFSRRSEVDWLTGLRAQYDGEGRLWWMDDVTSPTRWTRSMLLDPLTLQGEKWLRIIPQTVFWRKTLWEKAGSCLDTEQCEAFDYELFLRFSRHAKLYTLKTLLALIRRESVVSFSGDEGVLKEKIVALMEREKSAVLARVPDDTIPPAHLHYPATAEVKPRRKHFPAPTYRRKVDKSYPLISVVTPNFNQEEFLEETIDSVLSQDYPNFEYVIMDGGSTDGSLEVIRKYQKYLHYFESKPDGGQYDALNRGFGRTSGPIMTWINGDDVLRPQALRVAAWTFLGAPEEIKWITGMPNTMDVASNDFWSFYLLPKYSRKGVIYVSYEDPFVQQEGTFWTRELWNAAGGEMDLRWKLAGDLDLWRRFFRYARLYTVSRHLGSFRFRPDQRSAVERYRYDAEARAIQSEERQLILSGQFVELLEGPPPVRVPYEEEIPLPPIDKLKDSAQLLSRRCE